MIFVSLVEIQLGRRFHLQKKSGNSGWDVNRTRDFGSFHWKFSGIKETSEKVVPFSRSKLPNGKKAFRGLSRVLLQLRWRSQSSSFTPEFIMNYTNTKSVSELDCWLPK